MQLAINQFTASHEVTLREQPVFDSLTRSYVAFPAQAAMNEAGTRANQSMSALSGTRSIGPENGSLG